MEIIDLLQLASLATGSGAWNYKIAQWLVTFAKTYNKRKPTLGSSRTNPMACRLVVARIVDIQSMSTAARAALEVAYEVFVCRKRSKDSVSRKFHLT
mmetsp:Transcript_34658/g.56081  ORF Transcript_34658/g.56081 Transcript_34658/m.56081 type:complete len:97 (+) Transcript_34658:196-486(+)